MAIKAIIVAMALFFTLFTFLQVAGCSGGDGSQNRPVSDLSSDGDSDSDTDSDSDGDTDGDSDSDSDSDSDGDSDSDSDADEDSEKDTDSNSEDESDTGTDTDSEGSTDTESASEETELILPIKRSGGIFALEMTKGADTLLFECTGDEGGLITTFALNNENILSEKKAPNGYGSTFWIAPQTSWGNWPPPEEIYYEPDSHGSDKTDISVVVDEDTNTIEMTSTTISSLGVKVVKRFSPDMENFAINLEYVIVDDGSSKELAPWEISRVVPGGITFFPTGSGVVKETDSNMKTLPTTDENNVTWMDHTEEYDEGNYRYKADGSDGWLAHTNGDVVFIKSFKDEPFSARPDDQAEIQLFVNGGIYEEVEMMGAQESIPSGGESAWQVKWYLDVFPEEATFEVGDQSLVDYVDARVQ